MRVLHPVSGKLGRFLVVAWKSRVVTVGELWQRGPDYGITSSYLLAFISADQRFFFQDLTRFGYGP